MQNSLLLQFLGTRKNCMETIPRQVLFNHALSLRPILGAKVLLFREMTKNLMTFSEKKGNYTGNDALGTDSSALTGKNCLFSPLVDVKKQWESAIIYLYIT